MERNKVSLHTEQPKLASERWPKKGANMTILFARVEPPFMQEVHRSACAIFCSLHHERGPNTQTKPKNQTKPTKKSTKMETLGCTCKGETDMVKQKLGTELLQKATSGLFESGSK